jgi:hypothetical protein
MYYSVLCSEDRGISPLYGIKINFSHIRFIQREENFHLDFLHRLGDIVKIVTLCFTRNCVKLTVIA